MIRNSALPVPRGTILVPLSKVELLSLKKKVGNSSTLVHGAVLAPGVEPFWLTKN